MPGKCNNFVTKSISLVLGLGDGSSPFKMAQITLETAINGDGIILGEAIALY
jgi:hypothetical protein